MAIKAGRVGVNRSDVDELGHVTSGGLTPEERAKLEKALVTPVAIPTEKELVGVGTANEQIMFKIGDGLSVDGETSPFTLKASGGSVGGFTATVHTSVSVSANSSTNITTYKPTANSVPIAVLTYGGSTPGLALGYSTPYGDYYYIKNGSSTSFNNSIIIIWAEIEIENN